MKLFDDCKTCAVLKEQLDYERSVNKELTSTLTSLLKPIPVINTPVQHPIEAQHRGGLFSRRRAEMERADREAMQLKKTSPVVGKSDDQIEQDKVIAQLEKELDVSGETKQ